MTPTRAATSGARARGDALAFWGMALFVVAYSGVLVGAFAVQFVGHEFPCPLCMLQRYAMLLATLPVMWVMILARRGSLDRPQYVRALGMAIIACILGGAESTRQILLHIAPGDPGYGTPVLGLHLYTWALITFVLAIAYCGVLLMTNGQAVPVAPTGAIPRAIASVVVWTIVAVTIANLIAIVFLEGFAWVLPDDPTRYGLLAQLGIG